MSIYAKVKGREALEFPYPLEKLRSDFPQKSFSENISKKEAILCGVVEVHVIKTPHDSLVGQVKLGYPTQELRELELSDLVDPHTGEFYEGYSEENIGDTVTTGRWISVEEIIKLERSLAESNIRSRRDGLLQDTDWIVIKSYERGENIPAEWELYRQALRDITAQTGFPYSVEWPTKPE